MFLMLGALVFSVASNIFANRLLSVIHWGFLSAFFALTLWVFSPTSRITLPSVRRISILLSAFIFCLRAHGRRFMVRWLLFTRVHSRWEPTRPTVRVTFYISPW